jgi:putative endopeptidase
MVKTNGIKIILIGTIGVLLLNACKDKAKDYAATDPIYKNIDSAVKPGDDFFQYANGAWLKKNPIPSAYASWGIGNVVNEELRDRLKKMQ